LTIGLPVIFLEINVALMSNVSET